MSRTYEPKFIFDRESKSRKLKTGVVQGVLSQALFNYYLVDFPTPHPNIKLIKYVDDSTIYTSRPVVTDLINGLNIYLSQVLNYINNKKLTMSTAKSTVIPVTPDTNENHLDPQVKLADQVRPLKKRPKVLGVMLDTHLTFTQHCNNIAVKVQQHDNVLKAMAGSTWGCDKETLLTTYQAIGSSIISYCCPVWLPSSRDTIWSRLQRAQSAALRIETSCLIMADVAVLHQESRELPVRQHNEVISQQFALACHLPQNPCHQLCHRSPDDRPERRRSLIGRLKPNTHQYLAEGSLRNTSSKSAISSIHQDAVRNATESSSSRLLNGRPPPIVTDEQTLPRKTRTILAQQRTGHSRILGQYTKRIDPTAQDNCHDCGHSPHDTHHLFRLPFEADHTDSRIAMDCADRNRKHLNLAIDETS